MNFYQNRNLEKWALFIQTIRTFLGQKNYLEVFTPTLVQTGAFENAIDPLKVTSSSGTFELHTSPEIEMKKLLSQYKKSIFQITSCFRDDPASPIHGKEFTMLEFYKVNATYLDLISEIKDLLTTLTGSSLSFEETTIDTLYKNTAKIDLKTIKKENLEDIFFINLIEKIEPHLNPEAPTFIKNYPSDFSVLSKQTEDPFFSERFELYWKGMEICNGCTESTSIENLKRNFENENTKRKKQDKLPHPYPETFFESMKTFPDCAGVAIGLDRLFLCLEKKAYNPPSF